MKDEGDKVELRQLGSTFQFAAGLLFFRFACTLIHEQTSGQVCAFHTKLYQKVCFFSICPVSEIQG